MAETTWTEEQPTGPKKKSIPTWVWFCGGGCLLAVLLGVIAIGFGFRLINQARDPEVQWAKLAQVLPYDEPPPKEMTLLMGMHLVGDQYTFHDERGFQVQFQNHPGKDGTEGRKNMFDAEHPKFPQNMVAFKFTDLQPGTIQVQGRELRILRMRMELAGALNKMIPEKDREGMGSMAFVDLTPEGRDGMLIAQFTRMEGTDPVSDEEIRTILKPFHVGPDR
jgi:hypothetical protein